jgi:hypothetical protein
VEYFWIIAAIVIAHTLTRENNEKTTEQDKVDKRFWSMVNDDLEMK